MSGGERQLAVWMCERSPKWLGQLTQLPDGLAKQTRHKIQDSLAKPLHEKRKMLPIGHDFFQMDGSKSFSLF